MPRANRHCIPGYVWHITHRCHKKKFLLRFVRDRRRWMEWPFCGYNDIQSPRQRYSIIDYQRLISLLQMKDLEELQESCRNIIEEAICSRETSRERKWSESIAVGNKSFIEATVKRLGIKALGRKIFGNSKSYELREPVVPYGANLTPENGYLSPQNTYFWNDVT